MNKHAWYALATGQHKKHHNTKARIKRAFWWVVDVALSWAIGLILILWAYLLATVHPF